MDGNEGAEGKASCTWHIPCASRTIPCWHKRLAIISRLVTLQGLVFNEIRAKTKVIQEPLGMNPKDYPDWSFDGSSTGQAEGNNSDCILKYDQLSVHVKFVMPWCA